MEITALASCSFVIGQDRTHVHRAPPSLTPVKREKVSMKKLVPFMSERKYLVLRPPKITPSFHMGLQKYVKETHAMNKENTRVRISLGEHLLMKSN